ncbi:MAG: FAD-dependent oxidoreductase [Gemmatimonadales bacterium]
MRIGAGAGLLSAAAPALTAGCGAGQAPDGSADLLAKVGDEWYGPGGIGDYAPSHGNTPEVVNTAHALRDGRFATLDPAEVLETGERYDVVIVGAGMAGLGAAYALRAGDPTRSCLILDNHPVFGGESKRNELEVDGVRLIGPQGANGFSTPAAGAEARFAEGDARYYDELGIPREFDYAPLENAKPDLRFGRDNYGFIYWLEHQVSTGYFYRGDDGRGVWAVNPLQRGFGSAPVSAADAEALTRLMASREVPRTGDDVEPWLDTMSYKDVLERVLGYPPSATAHLDPIIASAIGLGCDAISAYAAYSDLLPGLTGYFPPGLVDHRHSFPGGNDGFARHFVKAIMPHAIEGDARFDEILMGRIRFAALDTSGERFRMRLAATVVSVEHDGPVDSADWVSVVYRRNGRLARVRARGVVMATGGWVNRHVVRDLPESHRAAYGSFVHAPFLVANVALRRWRFLERLGITACRYQGEFGFSCNLRQPMRVGDYRPALDPDRPALLTFYVPFYYPGHPAAVQGTMGRTELLGTSFADYEGRIRRQLTELFGAAGFDPAADIGGIVLNRWGHAYVAPGPGFYFGRDGRPAPRDVIRAPHGRIAFGHSELRGNQHWGPAADEGARAMAQVLAAS